MGSVPSPPPTTIPTYSYRVCACFCPRSPGTNMCNWIETYNPSDNSWCRIGTIPGLADNHVLKGFAMVAVRDSVYIIGGRLCRKDGGDEGDIEVLPTVRRLDVRTNEWSQCASLRTPRFDFACTVCGDKIYVAGGQSTLSSARGIPSAEVYDPALDEWNSLPNMNTLRYKCVAVTWQGKIFVVGGFAERDDSDEKVLFRSSAEVFDTWSGEWEFMVGMWQLDVPPNQIVAIDDRLYSSGDCLNTWKGHIEAYDGKQNLWNIVERSQLQNFSPPSSASDAVNSNDDGLHGPQSQRIYLTVAAIGTCLYFLAGYHLPGDLFRYMSTVHRFDTSATGEAWRSFEPIEEDRDKELCSHCCVEPFLWRHMPKCR